MMNKFPIKAIIFDMDGVLVDSEPHHVKIEKKMFAKLNLNISDEEHSTYMGTATDVMWRKIVNHKKLTLNIKDLVEQTILESKLHFSLQENLVPMSGLVELLDKFYKKDIPMAVASSSAQEIIDIILQHTNLEKYFKYTVSSELVGESKPEPDIFLHTAKLLGVKSGECVVIEDSANGIRAAKAANMFCIAYNGVSANNQDQSLADEQIVDFSELENILKL